MKPSSKAARRTSNFRTDADIAGRATPKERELQRWVPDGDQAPSLEWTDKNPSRQEWDQFEVNYNKFGVESSYDEHLYTTRINKNAPDYKERAARAEKLAREIEGLATTDRHMLEERGKVAADDLDDEDKYLGVDRRGDELMAAIRGMLVGGPAPPRRTPSPGKYVSPAQRAAQYHNDPAIVASSAAGSSRLSVSPAPKDNHSAQILAAKPTTLRPLKPSSPYTEAFRLTALSEINSLREFSANFKIPHKMPSDLLPILAKDKVKQEAIVKKVEGSSPTKKKMDPTRPAFKPNSNAVSFTPHAKAAPVSKPTGAQSANHGHYRQVPGPNQGTNASPRISALRTHSSNSNNLSHGSSVGSGTKRLHNHMTPTDFFGSANRVPTAAGQRRKAEEFKIAFSMFLTAQKLHKQSPDADKPMHYEKTYQTPPTWTSTIDEPILVLFPELRGGSPLPMGMAMPYGAAPPMGVSVSGHQMLPSFAPLSNYQQPHFSPPPQFVQGMIYPPFQGSGAGAMMAPMYPGHDPHHMPPAGMARFVTLPSGGPGLPLHGRASQSQYIDGTPPGGRRYNGQAKRTNHA